MCMLKIILFVFVSKNNSVKKFRVNSNGKKGLYFINYFRCFNLNKIIIVI